MSLLRRLPSAPWWHCRPAWPPATVHVGAPVGWMKASPGLSMPQDQGHDIDFRDGNGPGIPLTQAPAGPLRSWRNMSRCAMKNAFRKITPAPSKNAGETRVQAGPPAPPPDWRDSRAASVPRWTNDATQPAAAFCAMFQAAMRAPFPCRPLRPASGTELNSAKFSVTLGQPVRRRCRRSRHG